MNNKTYLSKKYTLNYYIEKYKLLYVPSSVSLPSQDAEDKNLIISYEDLFYQVYVAYNEIDEIKLFYNTSSALYWNRKKDIYFTRTLDARADEEILTKKEAFKAMFYRNAISSKIERIFEPSNLVVRINHNEKLREKF